MNLIDIFINYYREPENRKRLKKDGVAFERKYLEASIKRAVIKILQPDVEKYIFEFLDEESKRRKKLLIEREAELKRINEQEIEKALKAKEQLELELENLGFKKSKKVKKESKLKVKDFV